MFLPTELLVATKILVKVRMGVGDSAKTGSGESLRDAVERFKADFSANPAEAIDW
jgi:hypothetical protein